MELRNKISKFWPRIGAFLIDFIILGIFGFILGIIFEDFFVSLGQQGLLFGLLITLIYFSIGNSKISNGQTIGKKIVNIKTIDSNGNAISVQKSLARAIVLFTPYFLINYPIPGVDEITAINAFKETILISALIGIIVLFVANKSTRQSLHDLLLGTLVVNIKENEDPAEILPNSKIGIYLFTGLTVLLIGYTTYNTMSRDSVVRNSKDVIERLDEIDGVLGVQATRNTTTFYGDEKSVTESYTLILHVKDIPNFADFEHSNIVKKAIQHLFEIKPELKELDIINIKLYRGFNIGIAKKHYSISSGKSPEEWTEMIE